MSPQDAHAGRLLLGLLGLLLLVQHLLVQDQLNVLLSEVERTHNQVQGPVWTFQHRLVVPIHTERTYYPSFWTHVATKTRKD